MVWVMSTIGTTNTPSFIKIREVTPQFLGDLTWNDPHVFTQCISMAFISNYANKSGFRSAGHKRAGKDVIFFVLVKHGSNSPPLEVPGFQTFLSPVQIQSNNRSGNFLPGSAVFVPNIIEVDHLDICNRIEELCSSLCICCCFISSKHHCIAVVSVYCSLSTGLKDAISMNSEMFFFSQLLSHTNHIILAGDFNINLLGNSNSGVDYMNLLSDFGLQQHVSEFPKLLLHLLIMPLAAHHRKLLSRYKQLALVIIGFRCGLQY